MAFPQINTCLVAESLRQEARQKVTILGLYGATPYAKILVKDITRPVRPLSFVFLGGPAVRGHFKLNVRLVRDGESEAIVSVEIDVDHPDPKGAGSVIGIGFSEVNFPSEGEYKLILEVDGEPHYETSFQVSVGSSDVFKD